jgi:hypothetical protein
MRRFLGVDRMRWFGVWGLALLPVVTVLLLGCATPKPKLRNEISMADRQREWGLVYYQSWQKERNQDYLVMARQRTPEAVTEYLDVQRRMGYAYPDFYVVDRRRMQSCVFLKQMQAEAASYGIKLEDTRRLGCFN